MLRFYNYIYYRAYCGWISKSWGEGSAVWGSYIELVMLIVFNVLGLTGLLQIITGYKVFDAILDAPTWELAIVMLIFGICLNPIWGNIDKAKKIVSEFSKLEETPRQKFWRGVAINVYEAVWVLLFVGSALFMSNHPEYG